mgnify:CR=1 FL=1
MPGKLIVGTIETQNINFDSDTAGMTLDSGGHVSGQTKLASASPIDLTSNTSGYTFSNIPSVYDRLTLTFKAWSVAATANMKIQLGTSGGLVTSSTYKNSHHYFYASGNTQSDEADMTKDCFSPQSWNGAGNSMYIIAELIHHGDNTWFLRGHMFDNANSGYSHTWVGWVDVGGTLTQIKVFPETSSIDAGKVNLMYG